MPCRSLRNGLRIIKTELRQCATQEHIPGETDEKALEQLRDLLLSRRARKQRERLKDVYALLIWNMAPGVDVITCNFEEKLEGRTLTDEDIDILSRIQRQILHLPTSWDRKRSKWAYINVIRSTEPERMSHRRGSSFGKASTSTTLTKSSTRSSENMKQMPEDIQKRCDEISSQLTATVESGALGAVQVARLRASINGIYLIEARNELTINSLRECVTAQQETLESLRVIVERLQRNSTSGSVGSSKEINSVKGRRASTQERSGSGQFVFFDDA